MREYSWQCYHQQTPHQRQDRLQIVHQRAQERRATESNTERRDRLLRLREQAQQRRAAEGHT